MQSAKVQSRVYQQWGGSTVDLCERERLLLTGKLYADKDVDGKLEGKEGKEKESRRAREQQ